MGPPRAEGTDAWRSNPASRLCARPGGRLTARAIGRSRAGHYDGSSRPCRPMSQAGDDLEEKWVDEVPASRMTPS